VVAEKGFSVQKKAKLSDDSFRIGPIRNFIQKTEVVRFTRTLGTLIRSGVPILEAMTIVKDTMGNMVCPGSLDVVIR
jgi:type II secretory pathway component PulF